MYVGKAHELVLQHHDLWQVCVLSGRMGWGYCMCYISCTMTCCNAPLKETSGLGVLHVLLLMQAKKFQQKQSGGKWNWKDAKKSLP